jgi:hypothetical protein
VNSYTSGENKSGRIENSGEVTKREIVTEGSRSSDLNLVALLVVPPGVVPRM